MLTGDNHHDIERSTSKCRKGLTWPIAIAVIAAIAAAIVLVLIVCSFLNSRSTADGDTELPDAPVFSEIADGDPQEELPAVATLHSYSLDASGCKYLKEIAALVMASEDDGPITELPVYVFIAQTVSDDEPDLNDAEAAALYAAPVNELIAAARQCSSNWDISYEDYLEYMGTCRYVRCGKYLILVGDDQYVPLLQVFESAAKDPAVLDFEDLLSSVKEYSGQDETF